MNYIAQTQEEMRRQLFTPKREGELINPHISVQKAAHRVDYADISKSLQASPPVDNLSMIQKAK